MTSHKVELYIYDLSQGMAASISPLLLGGKKIDGIWHTSIVVYDREYFFGSHGVESCNPGTTALGPPKEVKLLGETQVPYSVFVDYLSGLSTSTYSLNTYNLFHHNCNNFTEDIAQFLCGTSIPKYILDLPSEVLSSSLGPAIPALVAQLEKSARPIAEEQRRVHSREPSPDLSKEIEEARYQNLLIEKRRQTTREKLEKKERKREKKRRKILKEGGSLPPELLEESNMAESAAAEVPQQPSEVLNGAPEGPLPSEQALALEEEERREEEERKKAREPPIVFKNIFDIKEEFDSLVGLIDGKLSPEEQKSTEELQQYIIGDEGSWALSDGFLDYVNRLLNDKSLPVEVRIKLLNILSVAALKDDVILVLHQDRKDHVIMNYAYDIDRLSPQEQEATALFIANMFENLSSSEWLLYISEWSYNNQQISNIRTTTKVAVHCLLSDNPVLQDRGSAIIYNLASKEVFDDVAVELTMALLQFFNQKPSEEHLFRCMKALSRFVEISRQEVPQLIQMIGPDPKSFRGTSERVDELIEKILPRIR